MSTIPGWPKVQFVSEPSEGADVLFDFNDPRLGLEVSSRGAYVGANGWSLGTPSLDGPVDATGLTWGERMIEIPFHVRAERSSGVNVLARLARQALRLSSWLAWQLDPSQPTVWFRTRAADPGDLSFDAVVMSETQASAWATTVRIPADAWAIGEPITQRIEVVSNDPAQGGNVVLLDPIVGDAPAPLQVSVAPTGTPPEPWQNRHMLVSTTASSVRRNAKPIYIDSAAFSPHPNAPAAVPARTLNGAWAGNYFRDVPIGDSVGVSQAMRPWLRATGGAGSIPVGKYAAFLQSGVNGDVTAYDVSTEANPRTPGRVGPSASSLTLRTWIYLGDLNFPQGVDISRLGEGEQINSYVIDIYARVASGSTASGARFGSMILVPIEGPGVLPATSLVANVGVGLFDGSSDSTGRRIVFDGDASAILGRTGAGNLARFSPGMPRGAYPVAHPGRNNYLTVLTQTHGVNSSAFGFSDDTTKPFTVEYSYRPRICWMQSTEDEWDVAKEAGLALNTYPDGPA